MPDVTITGDFHRLQRAMEDAMGEHWRHLASGLCQCGRSRSKDPAVWRSHMAEELMAVLMRFQPGIRREDVERQEPLLSDLLRNRFGPGTPERTAPEILRDMARSHDEHARRNPDWRREYEGTWLQPEQPVEPSPPAGEYERRRIEDLTLERSLGFKPRGRTPAKDITISRLSTAVDNPVDPLSGLPTQRGFIDYQPPDEPPGYSGGIAELGYDGDG